MLTAALLLFANNLLLSLRLSGSGSFPKPLTAAEEREYLNRYAQGDQEARNALIEHNLRLVAHVAKKYYIQSGEQDDLISIGTIGLIKAITSFDGSKGARLATYAARCIENAILSQQNNRRLRWRNGCLLRQNGACWREWESAAIF
ncbi:sigma-70 family RNA polymerase sigma factor [Dysosmobacter sp. HCP28S3_G4]|uniref:sigma-70 family RNA polymerase sigma factor n=1 Tax=Dysosmobacter sp. HCP28S3_G4 TaxID=3438938 RepID=UPI003F8A9CEF